MAKGKLKIVTSAPPPSTEKGFKEWERDNYKVMTWIWNNMESTVIANFMFLDTAKEIWEVVRDMYSMKNASRVFDVFEGLFSFHQSDKSLEDYSNYFKGMINELNQYHHIGHYDI